MASIQPVIGELNRQLMARGSAKRIRARCEGPLGLHVRFWLEDAPEVERRIGERYLQREGD